MEIRVYINNQFNQLATDSLLSFTLEDNIGLKLDSLEVSINNADDSITVPTTNSIIELAIGFNNNLYKMGKFIAQNIDATSRLIKIKAISQDLSKGKIKRNRVFKNRSLEDILKTLANDLDLVLQTEDALKSKIVGFYLQENKTNLDTLAELSDIFYATATIKDNNLIFLGKDTDKSLDINIDDVLSITKQDSPYKHYSGVIYNSWNSKTATLESIKLGFDPSLILPYVVHSSIKNIYINNSFKSVSQKQYIFLTMQGNPNMQAGFNFFLNTTGMYSQFNGKYRMEEVTHRYNNAYVCEIKAVKI